MKNLKRLRGQVAKHIRHAGYPGYCSRRLELDCEQLSLPALRVLEGKPLALFNPLGENQPSSSRRFKFFAIPAVARGFSDFAYGDCQALG
jgi:hypothetical protein